jgi:Nuclease-related domain
MAWPRIKNSRSSAQPGTQPHNGVQATVTPAPDAEPPPGSGQNTGISGTTHAVAYSAGDHGPNRDDWVVGSPWADRRRRRPIRYAHSAADQTAAPTVPVETVDGPTPATPGTGPSRTATSGPERPGTVLSGTVVVGPALEDDGPEDDDDTAGLVYEASHPAYTDPGGPDPSDEPEPVSNEGLGIFGDVATTEVSDDDDTPTRDLQRPSRWDQPAEPQSPAEPPPTRVIPIGAAWNQPVASSTVVSDEAEERRPNPFGRMRDFVSGAGQPPDDEQPRVSVRDLPPDVQLRFWRLRATIMVVVGVLFAILTRSWEIALTLAILAGIADTIYRSRNAALHLNGARFPGARKATSKQLRKMRREGYFSLDARPIPDSREFIDHLVVGPTGVYAIDSEKWNPRLPIRTWNGKKLYHGPESQKDRLEHAAWEASQASEILSGALGTEISVRPALAIYGPKIPWDIATIRNVDVFTGPALRKYLKRRSRMKEDVVRLTREEARTIYETAARMLPDVAQTYTPVG